MATWEDLKDSVDAIIKSNGNEEITGPLLNTVLKDLISNVGELPPYAGVAVPSTAPGTPDGPVFYLASQAGTYANFSGLTVNENQLVIFSWDGTAWTKEIFFTGSAIPAVTAFSDAVFAIYNDADNTKTIDFDASQITAGQTRTITMPDKDIILGEGSIYTPDTEPIVIAGTPNTITIDFKNNIEASFEPHKASGVRTIDAATYPTLSILFSDFANIKFFSMALSLTGTIAIQFPDGTGGQPNVKISQEGPLASWDDVTKILTITAGTDNVIGFVGRKDVSGGFIDIRVGGAAV